MKASKLNEWLQTFTSLGVLAGLLLVAYEIRENNAIAYQQAVSSIWVNWTELERSQYESGFSEVFAKSMTNPDDLSLDEQVMLHSWLSAAMSAWEQDYNTVTLSGGPSHDVIEELTNDVPFYFGNEFTRGWYFENKYWLSPEFVLAIDEKLESTPLGSDRESFERIMNKFP